MERPAVDTGDELASEGAGRWTLPACVSGGRHPGDSPAGHMGGPGVENQSQQTREPLPTGAGPEPFLQEAEGTMGSLWETSHWP